MALNMIAGLALLAGLYILYKADMVKNSTSKAIYVIAGIIVLFWSFGLFARPYTGSIGFLPLAFGLVTIGSLHSKGALQGAFAVMGTLIIANILF